MTQPPAQGPCAQHPRQACHPDAARGLFAVAAGLLWAALPASAADAAPPAASSPTLSLDQALQTALALSQHSGRLGALQWRQQASRKDQVAAAQRSDPVLKLGISNLPVGGDSAWSVSRDFMTMRNIGVMQELTRADKLAARSARSAAEGELLAAGRRLDAADLQRQTALAWLDSSMQGSLRGLLQAQQDEARLQVSAAEALYRSGRGQQADVFTARGEVERLTDRLAEVQREQDLAQNRLARWVGADTAGLPTAPRPEMRLPAWAEPGTAPGDHLATTPTLQLADRQQALAQAEVALADSRRRHDWSVELMFSQRGPSFSNMVSLNFSVPLVWDSAQRQDRELAAAQARARAALADREEQARAHAAELNEMLLAWRSHQRRLLHFDASLLPLAQQRLQAAQTSYRAGNGSLNEALAARRGLLALQVDRLGVEIALAQRWAQMTMLDTPAGLSELPATPTMTRSQP